MAESKIPAASKDASGSSTAGSASAPQSENLIVTYKTKFDDSLASIVTQKILASLLFFRQQIPCPLDQLIQAEEDRASAPKASKRRKLMSGTAKQTTKLVSGLRSSLPSINFSKSIRRVVLLIGSTVLSAKEIFIVKTDCYNHLDVKTKYSTPHDLQRKILRKFAMHWIQNSASLGLDCARIRPSKFYILVEGNREATLPGFQPKISFNLERVMNKKRRGRKVIQIHLHHPNETDSKTPSPVSVAEENYVWFQSKAMQGIS